MHCGLTFSLWMESTLQGHSPPPPPPPALALRLTPLASVVSSGNCPPSITLSETEAPPAQEGAQFLHIHSSIQKANKYPNTTLYLPTCQGRRPDTGGI